MIAPAASPSSKFSSTLTVSNSALRTAAEKFEAVFLRELIGSMRKAKLAEEVFGSSATESFREMADARTADTMAGLGQFGIASLLEKQFSASEKHHD
jgi:peptidoglycan hydrolase FlgJ